MADVSGGLFPPKPFVLVLDAQAPVTWSAETCKSGMLDAVSNAPAMRKAMSGEAEKSDVQSS